MIFSLFRRSKRSKSLPVGDQVRALVATGNRWAALTVLLEAHEADPLSVPSDLAFELIGTRSDLAAVLAAMDAHFDNRYYLARNPDVAEVTEDGWAHYLLFGWREGRSPSAPFEQAEHRRSRKSTRSDFPLLSADPSGTGPGRGAAGGRQRPWFEPSAPPDAAWDGFASARRTTATRAVVVMPVYKGHDETLAAIAHALAGRGRSDYSLLVVDDRSPDRALSAKLAELAAKGLFDLAVNETNLGFVGSTNRGLREFADGVDAVLLNSDAYVFPGWFERLAAHAADPLVGTVTPLSNNATICSYPLYNTDNLRPLELSPADLDRLAAETNAGLRIDVPTGVGFCMYVRRDLLDRIGDLDEEAFKLGYGEENDLCTRAREAGFRNVIAADVFVYHKGSVSFAEGKNANYDRGLAALQRKHPHYLARIRRHVAADPEKRARRRLDAARLARAAEGSVVFITHNWSGGIETFLEHQRDRLDAEGVGSLLLRVHDRGKASFETWPGRDPFVPNLRSIDIQSEPGSIAEILRQLRPRLVHVNSFAGLEWGAHARMLDLIADSGLPYDYVGHDYSAVSHLPHLLGPDGVYVGLPDLATRSAWTAMEDAAGTPDVCEPLERRARYRRFLEKARRILVPSEAAHAILSAEFPTLGIDIAPHDDHLPETTPARQPPPGRAERVVAVLGAIGPHKGSDILVALAAWSKERGLPIRYCLIGYSDRDAELDALGVTVTGRYLGEQEAFDRLEEFAPDLVLIPSIWPETFCYTLSIVLKKAIPPAVFDLGAQAERVRAAGCGVVLPLELAESPGRLTDRLLDLPLEELWAARPR